MCDHQDNASRERRFIGKVAIVTGAASGIGKATACQFAREGAKLVICGDINLEGLKETCRTIQAFGGECLDVKVDVRKQEDVEACVKTTLDSYGQIDILVNNAGTGQFVPFPTMQNAEYDRVMDTNVRGIFFFCRAVLPYMIQKNYGKIVNVTSIMSEVAAFGQSIYGASKAAAKMLTQGIAMDVAKYHINVNAVAPGMILTGLTRNMFNDEKKAEFFNSRIPKGRVGQSEEVASTILFLCSDDAAYIHGTTLTVDGGMSSTRV